MQQLLPRACAQPVRLVLQRQRILSAPGKQAAHRVHSFAAPDSKMQVPANTDVAIVGAGITGAIAARELQAAGARVQVFDMGGAPGKV
ncbi:hypothetical protein DUNSADRAFT_5302 [Dunaliella salina]|uniref:FAD dependent oxidoreductase domain-containing protein n=1 Tax=Dunaliella salina TaxID=3046 RepID=A0ABQ7GQJ0_DUNSA|nr:hypothetical protein DUNSADRAFT_5302 [Dunaliella salina]|eukprot:KAF5836863.1 hypothetical protein DUNSADRAFT_5302 [Dunaliella salina]